MPQSAERKPFTPEQSVPGAMNQEAIITRLIGRVFTHTVVKVVSVDAGSIGAAGFVDVVNLVQQLDGNNQGIPNQPLYRLPYFRLQGGANAVIIDPKIGDIGLAAFAMRDISKIKKTKEESAPPSRREYDSSDGLYIGGFLNGAPSQYIEFLDSGINVVATGDINVTTTANVNVDSGGDISANCTNLTVNCSGSAGINAPGGANVTTSALTVDAPTAEFSGAITALSVTTAGGALTPTGVQDSTGTISDLRDAYNSHTHVSADPGVPTSTTSDPV